MMGIPEMRRAY